MRTWLTFAVAGLLVAAAGCGETDEILDGGNQDGGYLDGVVQEDGGTMTDGAVNPPAEYLYVLVEDLSDPGDTGDGADVDAVELQKSGVSSWAASVEDCVLPDGSACTNTDAILGESDAFCGDPVDFSRCFSNYGTEDPAPYVTLGGTVDSVAGAIVVKMSEKIEEGDTLVVYEEGNCDTSATCEDTNTVSAAADQVRVSVSTSAEGPWTEVLAASDTSTHPKVTITIPTLPVEE